MEVEVEVEAILEEEAMVEEVEAMKEGMVEEEEVVVEAMVE